MKVEAEKCLTQSEKLSKEKEEFESAIYAKVLFSDQALRFVYYFHGFVRIYYDFTLSLDLVYVFKLFLQHFVLEWFN